MLHFGRLIDEHDAIDALADQLISAARSDHATPAECRAILRVFARQLRAHGAAEATFLDEQDPGGNETFLREIRSFKAEFAELAVSWHGYLRRWTARAITEDRPGFVQQTIDLITALKLRMERENTVIYPMAITAGLISPRICDCD